MAGRVWLTHNRSKRDKIGLAAATRGLDAALEEKSLDRKYPAGVCIAKGKVKGRPLT